MTCKKTLNVFEKYCNEWKLTANTSKTKIVIFSGGRAKQDHKFYFNGEQIEVLNEYKYLGVFLSSNGSYTKAKKHIIDQANNAMFSLLRKIRALNLPIDLQVELFNKTIKPILLYGCELWGTGNLESIERVQLKFLKQILNLKKKHSFIYGIWRTRCVPSYVRDKNKNCLILDKTPKRRGKRYNRVNV